MQLSGWRGWENAGSSVEMRGHSGNDTDLVVLQSLTMQQILISFHKRHLFQVFRPNCFCMFVTNLKWLNVSYHKFWNKRWKLFSVMVRCVTFDLSPLGLLILTNHDMYDLRAIYYCHWILPFARGWASTDDFRDCQGFSPILHCWFFSPWHSHLSFLDCNIWNMHFLQSCFEMFCIVNWIDVL